MEMKQEQNVKVSPEIVVSELMSRHPEVIQVFIKHQMSCVGCSMSGFETLNDAAAIYRLPLMALIQEMEEAIAANGEKGPA